jgi:uncharacterized repeat protein (TIGR03943 family)
MKQRETESFHLYIRGIILIGFGMLLFKLLVTGNIENFIAPKMMNFTLFTLVIVMLLGCVQIWESGKTKGHVCGCKDHDHSLPQSKTGTALLYSIFIIPIVTAFLFSDNTIDESIAVKRGVNLGGEQSKQNAAESNVSSLPPNGIESVPSIPTIQQPPKGYYEKLEKQMMNANKIDIDDDHYISMVDIIEKDVEGFKGKSIILTGFVHREEDFKRNEVIIARYGITCCVADASVLGMMTAGNGISSLKEGQWVRVRGVLDKMVYIDTLLPVIKVIAIEKISPPKTPYVYQKF